MGIVFCNEYLIPSLWMDALSVLLHTFSSMVTGIRPTAQSNQHSPRLPRTLVAFPSSALHMTHLLSSGSYSSSHVYVFNGTENACDEVCMSLPIIHTFPVGGTPCFGMIMFAFRSWISSSMLFSSLVSSGILLVDLITMTLDATVLGVLPLKQNNNVWTLGVYKNLFNGLRWSITNQ